MTTTPVIALPSAPEALAPADKEAWQRLAEMVPDATVFMWPATFDAWRRTIGAAVETEVVLARRGQAVVGVLPVMRSRVRRGPAFVPRIDYGAYDSDLAGGLRPFAVRQLSSIVSWRATSLRPTVLSSSADRAEVAGAMARALAASQGVDQIVLPVRQGEEAPWLDGFRAAGLKPWVHELGRSVLTLERVRPFDEILRGQSANFRKNIRRARAAAAEAGLTFRVLRGHEEVTPRMELLSLLAAESWKGQRDDAGRIAIPYEGPQQRFFEALIREPRSGLQPVLCLGEIADGPVFAALAFRHGSTLSGLLTFRRDALEAASPGLLGKAALVDWCAAEGIRRFDLNATQDWIRHLSDSTQRIVNVAAFRPTPRGRAYDLVARWRRRSEPARVT